MSNFKSSNTLRNSILAYPFPRSKRFKIRRPYYNDELFLETQKWLQDTTLVTFLTKTIIFLIGRWEHLAKLLKPRKTWALEILASLGADALAFAVPSEESFWETAGWVRQVHVRTVIWTSEGNIWVRPAKTAYNGAKHAERQCIGAKSILSGES